MIVLKKMHLLRSLLPATLLMGFSDQPERRQLSLSAQKAVWATAIIRTIASAALPSSIVDPSLRDVILNLPDPSKEFEFQVGTKDEVMELFKDGINLAQPFRLQSRVTEAQQLGNPPIKAQSSSPKDQPQFEDQSPFRQASTSQIQKQTPEKKFIFFPNRTVTTSMFKQLRVDHETPYRLSKNLLITGGFGISKTVSILLFIQLSSHQTRFVHETLRNNEKKKEYDQLIKLGLMPNKVVKYWYWSVKPQDNERGAIELIAEQAVELQQAVRDQLLKLVSLDEFITKLNENYPNLHFVYSVIIDQINTIASLLRVQNKQKSPQHTPQTSRLYELFHKVLQLGKNYILNSPVTIQSELLESNYQGLNLNLIDSHRNISNWHFPYEITLESQRGRIDFWQTFWFEFQRRIKQKRFNPTYLQIIKITFFQNISDLNISTFCHFFYARTYLSTHFQRFYDSVMSRIRENARNEVIKFQAYCLEQSKDFMQKFVKKGDQRINRIIFKAAYQLASSQLNQVNRNTPFIVPMYLLEEIVKSNLQDKKFSIEEFFKGNEHKGIIVSWANNEIRFQWTIGQFFELGKKIFISQGQKNGWTLLTIQNYKENPSIRGYNIQLYLRECLVEKGTMGFTAIDMNKLRIPEYFNIYQTTAFLPVNSFFRIRDEQKLKTYKGVTLQKNFGQAIKTAKDNPDTHILSLPFVFNEKGERVKYRFNSAVIDFLIVSYQIDLKVIRIWSFDVTIAQDPEDKIASAIKLHEFLPNDPEIKDDIVQLKHVLLCSKYDKIPNIKEKLKQLDKATQVDKKNEGVQADKTENLPSVIIEYALLQQLDVTSHSQHNIDQFWHHVRFNESIALKQQKLRKKSTPIKPKQQKKTLSDQYLEKLEARLMAENEQKMKANLQARLLEAKQKAKLAAAELEAKLMAENEQKMKAKLQVMFAKAEQRAKLAAAELEAKLMAEYDAKIRAKLEAKQKAEQKVEPKAESKHNQGNQENRKKERNDQ